MDTGLTTTQSAEHEILYVDVAIEGDQVQFDPRELALIYGREVPGVATLGNSPRPLELIPVTPEERRLVHNLRAIGANELQVAVALQDQRNQEENGLISAMRARGASQSELAAALRALDREPRSRDDPGIAYSSGQLLAAGSVWLRGTHGNAGLVPEQVAQQLRGRAFRNFDEFREAFWQAVAAAPELASQFSLRNRTEMRNGRAPVAPQEQHYGELRAYVLHHQRPIVRGGGVYDMSNILVVSPRVHQDILGRSFHFGRLGDQDDPRRDN